MPAKNHHHNSAEDFISAVSASVTRMRKTGRIDDESHNLDQIVKALNSVSFDLPEVDDGLLADLVWLLAKRPKNFDLVLDFVLKVCRHSKEAAAVLRDRLRLIHVLTDLYVELNDDGEGQKAKILQLMRFATHKIVILHRESFLNKLLPKILSEKKSADSLFILCGLTEDNFVVSKYLLSLLDRGQRKALFASEEENPKVKVLEMRLNLTLSKVNLDSGFRPNPWTHLDVLADAFCSAYDEDDLLALTFYSDFLQELINTAEAVEKKSVLQVMKQILLVSDASKCLANEEMFKFMRILAKLDEGQNPIELLTLTLRAIQPFLEHLLTGKRISSSESALLLRDLADVSCAKSSEIRHEEVIPQLDSAVATSVKLLRSGRGRGVTSKHLEALLAVSHADKWKKSIIAERVKADFLSEMLEKGGRFLAPCILLMAEMSRGNGNDDAVKALFDRTTENSQVRKNLIEQLKNIDLDAEGHGHDQEVILRALTLTSQCKNDDHVASSLERLTLSEAEDEYEVEVGDDGGLLREVQNLNEMLELADRRLALQNEQLARMGHKQKKSDEKLTFEKMRRKNAADRCEDIRKQFDEQQNVAAEFRSKLKKNEKLVENLEKENANLTAKATKYKEHNENLQSAIKEHQRTQQELQAKLRSEAKLTAELRSNVEKKEEKLKKKELQLDETMAAMEKVEAELDEEKKEKARLQSLSARQDQALAKKDKQIQEQVDELESLRKVQEQIFNLSRFTKKE